MSNLRSRRRLIRRPSGPPRLNRDSPQAQNLRNWWPLSYGAGSIRDFAGTAPVGALTGSAAWELDQEGYNIQNPASPSNDYINIGNIGELTYPFTLVAYAKKASSYARQALMANRTTQFGPLFLEDVAGGGLEFWTFDIAAKIGLAGTMVDDELMLCAVSARSDGCSLYIVGKTPGFNVAELSYSTTDQGGTMGGWRLGHDSGGGAGTSWRRWLYDCRIHTKSFNDDEIFDMSPIGPGLWDLWWRPKVIVPGFVVGAVSPVSDYRFRQRMAA